MNKIVNLIQNSTETENKQFAYRSLQNPLINLFSVAGALRSRPEEEIEKLVAESYAEYPKETIKLIFHVGNIRGGLGERRTFHVALRWLANKNPLVVVANMFNIPHYNRYDAWYALIGTSIEKAVWDAMAVTLKKDLSNLLAGKPISLLGKWLKSANASSAETRALAKKTYKGLGFSAKDYRKTLSVLREYLRVVERSMSANEWNEIEYAHVPSYAMKNYRNAFAQKDGERFEQFLLDIKEGKVDIKANVLYPYDLIKGYLAVNVWNSWKHKEDIDPVIEAQWKALPDYLNGSKDNILCMVDVSGSMIWNDLRPMASSVGLGTYFAQRNTGAFANMYMTFTKEPHFVQLDPKDTLLATVEKVVETDVGYSTNLEAAFEYLLDYAVTAQAPKKDMPTALIIISDNEIDKVLNPEYSLDFVEEMRGRYARAGYDLPMLIFYQVESRANRFLTLTEGVQFWSGNSTSVFKEILDNIGLTREEMVFNVLNDVQYDRVITEV